MVSIGIDLGITKCCMAVYKGNKVDVIPYSNSSRTVPSYISFWKEEILFGEEAVNRMSETIENTVYDIKRFIGRRFSDPVVTSNLNKWDFKVIDQNGSAAVSVDKIVYTPQELSGLLLIELKTKAEAYLGESVSNAVITVPTYFTDSQRKATVDAGRIAGFKEVRLLNEPTAAALAYNMNKFKEEKRMKLVVDFGGGTLDVSLVECEGDNVRVMAFDGDQDMGRNDMVHSMVEHMASKCELDLNEKQTFDEVCKNILAETQAAVERCLDDIQFNMDDIHEILMVGDFNDSKIQSIATMLETHFKKPVSRTVNLDEAVAIGAAIYASQWDSHFFFKGVNLSSVCPYSLGVGVRNEEDSKNEDVMDIIIKRYSSLPVKNTIKIVTTENLQTDIHFSVYCGEHKLVKNNKLLGNIEINGLRPAPAEEVPVEVTFELDINGILNVTVVDPERCTSKYLRLVLDKEGDIEKDMKTTIDLTQKRYAQSQKIKIFKESKNHLADLCDTLKKMYLSKCDNLEFNAENSRWLENMRLDLESIEKKVTNSPF